MKQVNIGLAGCGFYGKGLLRFFGRMPEYNVTAIAEPYKNFYEEGVKNFLENASVHQSNAQIKKPAYYASAQEMIDRAGIEAVLLATPNYQHTAQCVQAMEKGLAVYVEKPVACTVGECRQIAALQKRTNAKLMVGMQQRYSEKSIQTKKIIDEGIIGKPVLLWYREFRMPFLPGADRWRLSNKNSGGSIVEKNVHQLDIFNWYTGANPAAVMAMGGSDVIYGDIGLLDNAVMIVEYDSGAKGTIGMSLFSAGSDSNTDFYIAGERGVLRHEGDRIIITPNTGENKTITYETKQQFADIGHGGTEYGALRAFYDYVTEGKPPLTGINEGLLSVAMAIAAQISIAEKRLVKISEILPGSI
ncbi:MAG: Gfo/Idh/MocA family oxidoreductase [Treponema sp.]|nr:Gfo/Idh/MocA family oxidoreductase [Treponema sp.]